MLVGCGQDLSRDDGDLGGNEGGKQDGFDSDGEAQECTLAVFQDMGGPPVGEVAEDVNCGAYTVTFIDASEHVTGYDTWVVTADLDDVELVVSDPMESAASNPQWAMKLGLLASINGNMFGCYVGPYGYYEASSDPNHDDRCPSDARKTFQEFGEEGPFTHRQYPIGLHCNAGTCTYHQPTSAPSSTHMLFDDDGVRSWPVDDVEPVLGCELNEWSLGTTCDLHHAVSGMMRLVAEGEAPASDDVVGANTYLYEDLVGWIPLLGIDADGTRVYLGMSKAGAETTAATLVKHFGPDSGRDRPIWEAVGFDSGDSPSLWLGGGTLHARPMAGTLPVPVRIGLRER